MSFELYLKNITSLSEALALKQPIVLDESLSATFVSNHQDPLLLKVGYDLEDNTAHLEAIISCNMPQSRLGIQSIMNQLVADLLTQDPSTGRLVACPKNSEVKLILTLDLTSCHQSTLSDVLPTFSSAACRWRQKFKEASPYKKASSNFKPKEIISFESI